MTQRQLLKMKNLTLVEYIELCRAAEMTAAYVERMNDTADAPEHHTEVLAIRNEGASYGSRNS